MPPAGPGHPRLGLGGPPGAFWALPGPSRAQKQAPGTPGAAVHFSMAECTLLWPDALYYGPGAVVKQISCRSILQYKYHRLPESTARPLGTTGGPAWKRGRAVVKSILGTYTRYLQHLGAPSRHPVHYLQHLGPANVHPVYYLQHLGPASGQTAHYLQHLGPANVHPVHYLHHLSPASRHPIHHSRQLNPTHYLQHLGHASVHPTHYLQHLGHASRPSCTLFTAPGPCQNPSCTIFTTPDPCQRPPCALVTTLGS